MKKQFAKRRFKLGGKKIKLPKGPPGESVNYLLAITGVLIVLSIMWTFVSCSEIEVMPKKCQAVDCLEPPM